MLAQGKRSAALGYAPPTIPLPLPSGERVGVRGEAPGNLAVRLRLRERRHLFVILKESKKLARASAVLGGEG
jgi:hypothetical protein